MVVLALLFAPVFGLSRTIYHDKMLHFTWDYPTRYEVQGGAENALKSVRESDPSSTVRETAMCMAIPLRLKGRAATPYVRLLIAEIDFDCLNKALSTDSLPDLTKDTMGNLLASFSSLRIREPKTYILSEHQAAYITASAKADGVHNGMKVYAVQSCAIVSHFLVCWNFLSSDKAALPGLVAGHVQFEGHIGVPLIPVNLPLD